MNGINYNFTEKEIEAIAELLRMARNFNRYGQELSKIIATALNREAFKSLYKKEDAEKIS
jgi:hypothetical protein